MQEDSRLNLNEEVNNVINSEVTFPKEKQRRFSAKKLANEDKAYIKTIYDKIKYLKEEIYITEHNDLITNMQEKTKYINTLQCTLDSCYRELEFCEKMQDVLNVKDSVDDYLDKKGSVKPIDYNIRHLKDFK